MCSISDRDRGAGGIQRVVTARGIGGNYVEDLQAIKSGGIRADGEFLFGEPITSGFKHVKEPGEALSVMLMLAEGHIALGDCCGVVYAGYGGRDPVLRAAEAEIVVSRDLSPWLAARDPAEFRKNVEALERDWAVGEQRIHTAIRYGVSQALLHAAALTRCCTMAQVVMDDYGFHGPLVPIPVIAQSGRERYRSVERMILKQVPVIPHGDFTGVQEVGAKGERLYEYIQWIKTRVAEHGERGYRPSLHFDVYGAIGDAFMNDADAIAEYLVRLAALASPHSLTVECPVLVDDREQQIQLMSRLRAELRRQGSPVRIVADEHCNDLDDIRAFADAGAADMIQIKTPDLGSISQAIEAVRLCHDHDLLAFLGGSCNETDWASRVTVNVALATKADLIYNKPGFGVDEGYMIVNNEMQRVISLTRASVNRDRDRGRGI